MPFLNLFRISTCTPTARSSAALILALALPILAQADRLLPDTVTQVNTGNRATNSLIEIARQYLSNGAPESAANELERAIRIAPRTGLAWHELARVRFVQGRHADAESLATKAAILIGNTDPDLKYANDRLQQLSERAQGKLAGQPQSQPVKSMQAKRVLLAQPKTQPALKIQSVRSTRTASSKPAVKKQPQTQPQTPVQTHVQPQQQVARTTQAQATTSITTTPKHRQPTPLQPSATAPPKTSVQHPQLPIADVADTSEQEIVLSPARPVGALAAARQTRVQTAANVRSTRRSSPPVSSTRPRDPSQPAVVVDRSAPQVPTNRLIKRHPEKTRMTILMFQARHGAPVVEKSLIYQHPKPSPVAVN